MRIEKGDYLPKVALLENFARALGVRVEDLLASQ
jgi:DNA-binding XRE family transcriptional regulator